MLLLLPIAYAIVNNTHQYYSTGIGASLEIQREQHIALVPTENNIEKLELVADLEKKTLQKCGGIWKMVVNAIFNFRPAPALLPLPILLFLFPAPACPVPPRAREGEALFR